MSKKAIIIGSIILAAFALAIWCYFRKRWLIQWTGTGFADVTRNGQTITIYSPLVDGVPTWSVFVAEGKTPAENLKLGDKTKNSFTIVDTRDGKSKTFKTSEV